MKIEKKCSWCGRSLGWVEFIAPNIGDIQRPVTHGICPNCLAREMAKINTVNIANERKRP